MKAMVKGTGRALPDKVLTNAELEKIVDTTDEWITMRTGIKERRIATADESLSDFALPAAERALESAGISGSEVDIIICATVSPDMSFPATATLIQDRIGARGAAAFDLSAACSGYLYGLNVAAGMIRNG